MAFGTKDRSLPLRTSKTQLATRKAGLPHINGRGRNSIRHPATDIGTGKTQVAERHLIER